MKKAKTIGITFGVAALAVAGGAALALNMGSVAKEVKADPATTRLYLDMSGFTDWYKDSASFKVHTWNEANGDQYFAATKVDGEGGDAYYYADVDLATYAAAGGYRFTRFNPNGTEWNRGAWRSYADGITTYYRASDWTDGTWSTDDQSTWKVAGATNGVWAGSDEDISISLNMRFNNEGLQFYSTSVTLAAGSVFKVQNVTASAYYGFEKMDTNSLTASYFSGEGNNNITVVKGGTFELYMKPSEGRFWMQVSSETEATTFASSFLTATNDICSAGSTSADHATALADIWDDQCNAWKDLTLGAQNIFKTGTANATIKDAHDRYVHIMTRYNATLDPFEGGPSYGSPALNVIFGSDKSFVPAIIIATVSLGAIAAAAGFVFLRKKRNNA